MLAACFYTAGCCGVLAGSLGCGALSLGRGIPTARVLPLTVRQAAVVHRPRVQNTLSPRRFILAPLALISSSSHAVRPEGGRTKERFLPLRLWCTVSRFHSGVLFLIILFLKSVSLFSCLSFPHYHKMSSFLLVSICFFKIVITPTCQHDSTS